MNPGIALRKQMLLDLGLTEIGRHPYLEAHHQTRVACLRSAQPHVARDVGHRIASYCLAAAPAVQAGGTGKQQLQMIVEFGHRAHGGARSANGIGLIDRDGGRHSLDAVDLGLVHAVEELARIGGEGLDVAPLPLGVKRIEDQR